LWIASGLAKRGQENKVKILVMEKRLNCLPAVKELRERFCRTSVFDKTTKVQVSGEPDVLMHLVLQLTGMVTIFRLSQTRQEGWRP